MADLSAFVAQLYDGVFNWPLAEFKERAMASVEAIIPFDSGIWASGVHSANMIFSVALHNYPAERLVEYAFNWQDHDFVRAALVQSPGRSLRNEDVMPLAEYHQTAIYRNFSSPSGIEHTLGTVTADHITTVGELVYLFRANSDAPFEDAECLSKEQIMPYLVAAWRHKQVLNSYESKGQKSVALYDLPAGYAVVDENGHIHAADEAFSERVRTGFADWTGPVLPPPLLKLLKDGAEDSEANSLRIAITRGLDRHILSVAESASRIRLSPGERRAAERSASGETHIEIANALGLSVFTVRNQIANAYKKLGVHNKVGLLRALSGD